MREDEVAAAQELIVASINDLPCRHGFGDIALLRPTTFQAFSFGDDPAHCAAHAADVVEAVWQLVELPAAQSRVYVATP